MNIFFLFAAIALTAAHIYLVFFDLKSQMIEKWKNILIYEDEDFTNRSAVIYGDWDSLLYGSRIKRSLLFFSFLRRSTAVIIFGMPFIVGMMIVIAYGDVDGSIYAVDFNTTLYGWSIACYYAVILAGMIYHAANMKKYKTLAAQAKALSETEQILK